MCGCVDVCVSQKFAMALSLRGSSMVLLVLLWVPSGFPSWGLSWKTTLDGRRPLTEDDLWRKTTFDRRWPWWMTTFDVRRPLIGCLVYYLNKKFMTPHLDSHSTTDPKPEILSAVLTGNRISRDGRNVRGIMHVHMCRKDDIFSQIRLNHSGVGGAIAFRKVYPARAYSTVVVLVSLLR